MINPSLKSYSVNQDEDNKMQPVIDLIRDEFDNTDQWPEPELVNIKLPKVLSFTADMLPLPFKAWLLDISNRMKCPLDFVAVSAIVSAGSIIGSRCGVKPKQRDNWMEVPNLWGAVIADPSQLKTPSTSEVLKVFTPLEIDAKNKFAEEISCYKAETQIMAEETKAMKKKIKGKISAVDKATIIEQIKANEKANENKPILKRYRTNDATAEKVADICSENPTGILVFRDELTGLLTSWDRIGNEPHRAFFLEGWNGKNSYIVDRVIKGTHFIDTLCLSVFGGIQPDKLQAYLREMIRGNNDGMIQRLQLMVYSDPAKWEYVDQYQDSEARKQAWKIFHELAAMEDFISVGAGCTDFDKIPAFRFDDESQLIFINWLLKLQSSLEGEDISPYMKEHLGKYRSLMPCLSLIFHLVNIVQSPKLYNGPIKKESVLMAIKWCEVLESHADRVYNGLGRTQKQSAVELSKKISSGIIRDNFSLREIQQKNWHLLNSAEEIKEGIGELIEAGWVIELTIVAQSTGRPPAPRYKINPKALNFYSSRR